MVIIKTTQNVAETVKTDRDTDSDTAHTSNGKNTERESSCKFTNSDSTHVRSHACAAYEIVTQH